jgi:pimeloyl-ACP methyl ester carboxylesterase
MSRKVAIIFAIVSGFVLALASVSFSPAKADERDGGDIARIDYGVPHISTVPANLGERVKLFVREVVSGNGKHDHADDDGPVADSKVVLFVHGGSVSSVPDYDLQFKNYSWAEFLVKAGFDVFMMDQTGYGFSPRPKMIEPCNTNPAQQALLIPNPLHASCLPSYHFGLTTTQSDADEINTVVDFIRALRGVDRVNLVGWSGGGPRIGVFAAQHPQKVAKLFFYATGTFETAASGWPMNLQSHQALFQSRWGSEIGCQNQVDPEIRPVIWRTIMSFDPLGSTWFTPEYNPIASPTGGIMRFPNVAYRWTATQAAQIQSPSLLVVGGFDGAMTLTRNLYRQLGTQNKVLIEVACASHFLVWENQHAVLLEGSEAWFREGSIKGIEQGVITVDPDGKYHRQ